MTTGAHGTGLATDTGLPVTLALESMRHILSVDKVPLCSVMFENGAVP